MHSLWQKYGCRSLSPTRYLVFCFAVVCQCATILYTWPLWQVRETPPHLPMAELPQVPFGVALLGWLAIAFLLPKPGAVLHLALLLLSFVFDEFREQPQFILLGVYLFAIAFDRGAFWGRWILVSTWFWAGLHKLLSPEWRGPRSWQFAEIVNLDPEWFALTFAIVVAVVEMLQGILAIVRPRVAAMTCVPLHLGIVVFLTPWFYNWNFSVIPWNLATAAVGCWLFWNATPPLIAARWQGSAAAVLMILPAGFYLGWVDHGIAGVLYSEHHPYGLITTPESETRIEGWGDLKVPFPNEQRLLERYFERAAPPGAKLHVADPRAWVQDRFFVKRQNGQVDEITPKEFFAPGEGEVAGVGLDSATSIFELVSAKARLLKRKPTGMVYAVEIFPEHYNRRLLEALTGLPNLEQLQLAGCPVTDADLPLIMKLPNLTGLGISKTKVTPSGVQQLRSMSNLRHLEGPN